MAPAENAKVILIAERMVAGDELHQGGFAAAVRPGDEGVLARTDAQAQPAENRYLTVAGKDYKRLMIVEPIFPMIEDKKELEKIWDSASEMIAQYLNSGRDVAFITLGDTSIFSTYSYVQKRLIDSYEIETVPGITSFTACAAAKNEALVEQNDILTVVPKIDDRLEEVLEYSDSIVLMKASRNTSKLESAIEAKNRPKKIYSVQNCTRENEKIIEGFFNEKPYLTTTIIKFDD